MSRSWITSDETSYGMKSISADYIVTSEGLIVDGYVTFEDGVITEISSGSSPHADTHKVNGYLIPGFVDIHCHGGGGHSFGDPSQAKQAAAFHAQHGTTSIIASLVSASVSSQAHTLREYENLVHDGVIAGVHLEGPFLSHAKCGAQNPAVLVDPTSDAVIQLLEAGSSSLTFITIAPELPGALDAIRTFTEAGVVVAIGHSDATAEQAKAGVDAGATIVTHLFNAMRPVHHRDSGLADHALVDDRLCAEVIADGIHLTTQSLQLAHRAKQDNLIAITDAISATGIADGDYVLGELDVTSSGGVVTLRGTSTLAGSALTMDRAFGYLINQVGLDVLSAVKATSTTPARALGLDAVGSITVGKTANFVAWDSELISVWRNGDKL